MATETTIGALGAPTYDYTTVQAWVDVQRLVGGAQHGIMYGPTVVAGGNVTGFADAGTDADPHVLRAAPGHERVAGVNTAISAQQGVVEAQDLLFSPIAGFQNGFSTNSAEGVVLKVRRCLGVNPGAQAGCSFIYTQILGGGGPLGVSIEVENCEAHDLAYGISFTNFGFLGVSTANLTVSYFSVYNCGTGVYVNTLNLGGAGSSMLTTTLFENAISMDSSAKDFDLVLADPAEEAGTFTINNSIDSDNTIVTEYGGGTDCLASQVAANVFTDAPNGDLTLIDGSPAADAGKAIAGITTDILGVTRPQGTSYDMGCYETFVAVPEPEVVLNTPPRYTRVISVVGASTDG